MKSYSHWGMFPCWEQGLPPMVEQPINWMHVHLGSPYHVKHYTLAEALGISKEVNAAIDACEDDLKLTIVKT